MSRLADNDDFSGTVLLAKDDKVLFKKAYGFANRAFNARNDIDTKLNLGSMGKMFTGVAILQLAQQGKLSLNDTVLKLVPDYPDKDLAAKITVHQLLTHTSGLGNFFNDEFERSSRAKYRTTAAHLPLFTGKPLRFEPGTSFYYSNAGFIVLGLIIEKVSGQSYYDYVREHIFKPTGMLDTDNYNSDDDVPNLALGYTMMGEDRGPPPPKSEGWKRRSNILMHVVRGSSSGGGYSTVEDLLRFSRALQGHRLLNQEYTDLDMTGKVAMDRGGGRYAYGMVESKVDGVRIVGHTGGFPGIAGALEMYPDLGYTVAVLSNYDEGVRPVMRRLRYTLTGNQMPRSIRLSAQSLRAYAGKYDPSPDQPPIEIAAGKDSLSVSTSRGTSQYLPLSAEEFFSEDNPRLRLEFQKDDKGAIAGITLTGTEPNPIQATRVRARAGESSGRN
jgi:CubicO group peptidase (beta-lactamase class C family)